MSDPVVAQALASISARITEVREDVREMRKEVQNLARQVPTTAAMARINSCMAGQCPNKVQEVVTEPKGWLDRPIVLPLAMLAVTVILVVVIVAAFTGRKGADLMPTDVSKTTTKGATP
jgi:hypothetical protein